MSTGEGQRWRWSGRWPALWAWLRGRRGTWRLPDLPVPPECAVLVTPDGVETPLICHFLGWGDDGLAVWEACGPAGQVAWGHSDASLDLRVGKLPGRTTMRLCVVPDGGVWRFAAPTGRGRL